MRAVDINVLVTRWSVWSRATSGSKLLPPESFVSKGAWVSTLVLMEATWVLTAVYELTHAEIATAIDMLLHFRDLTLQESDNVAAALEQYRNRPAFRGLGLFDPRNSAESRPPSAGNLRPKSLQTRRCRGTVALPHSAPSEK